jgi:hypothetical protein
MPVGIDDFKSVFHDLAPSVYNWVSGQHHYFYIDQSRDSGKPCEE